MIDVRDGAACELDSIGAHWICGYYGGRGGELKDMIQIRAHITQCGSIKSGSCESSDQRQT